jgi:hypothetical protein
LPCESTVASAWLHLAAGDPAAANTIVTSVLDGRLATPVHPFTLTEAWLVDAVARAELGDDATASTSLERALREAAPEGYTQVFVDGGASVPALLARQMELGIEHASFIVKLQGIVEAHPYPGQRQPAVLSEPLTTRELTVLRSRRSCTCPSTPSSPRYGRSTGNSAPAAVGTPSSGPSAWDCCEWRVAGRPPFDRGYLPAVATPRLRFAGDLTITLSAIAQAASVFAAVPVAFHQQGTGRSSHT